MNDRTFHHQHAHKLDAPERNSWLAPAEVVKALGIRAGEQVADLGAGTGYFALPFAAAAGAAGWVAAVDLQPEMLALLHDKPVQPGAAVIARVLGSAIQTGLPGGAFDLVFLGNVWHELDDLDTVIAEARRLLRPGGRIAILDWRSDVTQPPGPPLEHRIPVGLVVERLRSLGLDAIAQDVGRFSYLVLTSG